MGCSRYVSASRSSEQLQGFKEVPNFNRQIFCPLRSRVSRRTSLSTASSARLVGLRTVSQVNVEFSPAECMSVNVAPKDLLIDSQLSSTAFLVKSGYLL